MENQITLEFPESTHFLGRNGISKCSGLCLQKAEAGKYLAIFPINLKNLTGSSRVDIPESSISELKVALHRLYPEISNKPVLPIKISPEKLEEMIKQNQEELQNEGIETPEYDHSYFCETCESTSGACHPVTGMCFICGADDWAPVTSPPEVLELHPSPPGQEKVEGTIKCAIADLEGIMPVHDPDGDRTHPGWGTLADLKRVLANLTGDFKELFQELEDVECDHDKIAEDFYHFKPGTPRAEIHTWICSPL